MRITCFTEILLAALVLSPPARIGAAPTPVVRSVPTSPSYFIDEPRLKFITTAEGVYRVTYEQLAPYLSKMGDPRNWSLWCAGRQVPMLVFGEQDGRFGRGDYIEWFAPRLQTPYNRVTHGSFDADTRVTVRDAYTTQGVYYLRFARGSAAQARPLRLRDVATTVPIKRRFWKSRTFRRFKHFEKDLIRRNFKPDKGAEYTDAKFWDHFSWSARPFRHYFLDLVGLDPNSDEPCSLTIKLWGMNHPRSPREHQARIGINKVIVGEARWPGVRQFYFTTTTLPAKIFKEWGTEFSLEAVARSSPDLPDVMLLDWIEVVYPSVYRADRDLLDFVGPPLPEDISPPYKGWLNPLALETFKHEPIWALDVTAGERRRLPLLRKWRLRRQNYYNACLPIAKTGHRYIAYTPASLRTPSAVRWVEPDRLLSRKQGADYLIITHEKFLPEAQRLAKHRARLGLHPFVVTTDEIADSFHHGFANIVAIKQFIRYAYYHWKPRPRFVLLVGDASWDDLGIEGSEFANYLPTYYYESPRMGFYASDNWFVCVDGDDEYPDMAIGRLPVRLLEQARAYVDKVIEYDTNPAPGDWRRSALLISSYSSYSHRSLDDLAKKVLQGLSVERCYTTARLLRSRALTTTVTKQFDRGHLVVVFAGHGGSFVWQVGGNVGGSQAPDLFSPRNVEQLTNRGKYPLVLALTCYTNSFDNPLKQTIGESLILAPKRGAVGVISASWRGTLQNEFPLASAILKELRENPRLTVGEALVAAKRAVHRSENTHGVCLLGDPALRIYFDSRPNNLPSR